MDRPRDTKPWAGQLYISHSSEATCKQLYMNFFRKTDCTILHGQWQHILLEQRNKMSVESSLALRRSAPQDEDPADKRPNLSSMQLPFRVSIHPPGPAHPPSPTAALRTISLPTFPSVPSTNPTASNERDRLIASSRHGVISPGSLEPFKCFILFYTSCWTIPRNTSRRLARVFGPSLVPRIEEYIRDECNGEQLPGTSFILDTNCKPCRFIVCTSIARDINSLSPDYAYNAFRSSLLAIHNYNRSHPTDQITSILCPALDAISDPHYNLVHQMATCYEYWDWRLYAKGAVLPFTRCDEENINKEIKATSPSISQIAHDLNHYMRANLLVERGLVYESELQMLLECLNSYVRGGKKPKEKQTQPNIVLPPYVVAQVLVDLLKRPDIPPFTLTPSQICAGITGPSLQTILQLAAEHEIRIYDEIRPQHLKLGDIIAKGTSGKVFVANWGAIDVAAKVFIDNEPEIFLQELTITTLVRHPKLVQTLGGYHDRDTAYMVTELMDMSLRQVFQQKTTTLDNKMKISIATDIAEAMEFLHSRKIIHRDLKSLNILLNQYTMSAKICDFGLSRVIDCSSAMTGNVGTAAWMAPEVLLSKNYTEKCDVYSFGMVMYELLTQSMPFPGLSPFKIKDLVTRGERPSVSSEVQANAPKEFIELMKMCWHENQNKRPPFSTILVKLKAMTPSDTRQVDSLKSPKAIHDDEIYTPDSDDETEEEDSISEDEEQVLAELKAMLPRVASPLITEELLLKCIRARHYKATSSKRLLGRYIEWYHVLNAGNFIKITDVRKTLESRLLYYPEGSSDREGHNIIFWDLRHHDVDEIPEPVLMRTFVYCLERATEKVEPQIKGIIMVVNLTDWSMAQFSKRVITSFFGTVRKYFPVIVTKILFLNAPGWFSMVLTMYHSFISSTMSLIELVTQQRLLEHVAEDNLVPGANGTFHFDMDLWIRTRYNVEGIEYQ